MMKEYCDGVIKFMHSTTVQQLMDHWPGKLEIPPNFSKLLAKIIDEDPTTYTLYELDQLRRRYCCEHKLTDLVFVIIVIDEVNSFIVQLLIPSDIVFRLVASARQVDVSFYLRERILKVQVNEKQIFPFLSDSVPKVSALYDAAVTVKIISIIQLN